MNGQTPRDFSKQLIKGKIAEMVFDQMFRREGKYTVIPFGYEAIIPELMQYTNQARRSELIDNIRSAPDFALVTHDPKNVILVEVKYRSVINMDELKLQAEEICSKWKLVWLFVASPEGFYLSPCNEIMDSKQIQPLQKEWIPESIQAEYLDLLKQFIRK